MIEGKVGWLEGKSDPAAQLVGHQLEDYTKMLDSLKDTLAVQQSERLVMIKQFNA